MIALLDQILLEAKIKKQLREIIFGRTIFCPSVTAYPLGIALVLNPAGTGEANQQALSDI